MSYNARSSKREKRSGDNCERKALTVRQKDDATKQAASLDSLLVYHKKVTTSLILLTSGDGGHTAEKCYNTSSYFLETHTLIQVGFMNNVKAAQENPTRCTSEAELAVTKLTICLLQVSGTSI